MQVLGDRILIKRDNPPDKIGNILLAESVRHDSYRAYVMQTGPRVNDEIKTGDCILIVRTPGVEVNTDGGTFYIIREHEAYYNLTSNSALGRWILVEREILPEKIGSLIVPESYRGTTEIATILSLGKRAGDFEKGQKIIVPKTNDVKMEIEGKKCVFVIENNILCILTSSPGQTEPA